MNSYMLNPSLSTNLKDKLLLSLPSQDANAIATFSILGKIANIRLPFLVNQQLAVYLGDKILSHSATVRPL